MQTQSESTDTDMNATINPIAKRLARLPHVIKLPAETPESRELD